MKSSVPPCSAQPLPDKHSPTKELMDEPKIKSDPAQNLERFNKTSELELLPHTSETCSSNKGSSAACSKQQRFQRMLEQPELGPGVLLVHVGKVVPATNQMFRKLVNISVALSAQQSYSKAAEQFLCF